MSRIVVNSVAAAAGDAERQRSIATAHRHSARALQSSSESLAGRVAAAAGPSGRPVDSASILMNQYETSGEQREVD